MSTYARLLRADAEEFDTDPPKLSKRRQEQRDRIFRLVPRILARRGVGAITIQALALALDVSTACLRRHVIDMDYLLYKILVQHLQFILDSVLEIPAADPACHRKRAAILAGATHPDKAIFDAAQLLWSRDRQTLPDDLNDRLEELRADIDTIAGASAAREIPAGPVDPAAPAAAQPPGRIVPPPTPPPSAPPLPQLPNPALQEAA